MVEYLKPVNIFEELVKKLEQSGDVLRVGTRKVYCKLCKNNHVIPEIPGVYDLCTGPHSVWKGLNNSLKIRLKEDGDVELIYA